MANPATNQPGQTGKRTWALRPWLGLISFIGVMVPSRLRADWRQEWVAELHYREASLAEWDQLNRRARVSLVWRSASAFWDALWMQTYRWEDAIIQDLRYCVRGLVKHPGFTLVAVATLALGIGVNAALFTVFDSLMLKPLPLKDPNSLINLSGADQNGGRHKLFSYLDYLDYRNENTTLVGLVAWSKAAVVLGEVQLQSDHVSEGAGYIFGQIVSANYFSVLGAEMTLGRAFSPEEDRTPGTHPVIVLSHQFWNQQFAGDPNIVGTTIRLQSRPFTVVGVTAPEFIGTTPDTPAFYVPTMMRDQVISLGPDNNRQPWLTERDADSFLLLGRLKSGVTPQQAQAEMSLIAQHLGEEYPGKNRKMRILTTSGASFINLETKQLPLIIPVVLGFSLVLLIACANVANLMLARAAKRQKEIGVRYALGASRLRVIRQLLTESLLIAAIGGFAGLIAASWILRLLYVVLLAHLPDFPPSLNLRLDYRIFGFTLFVTIAAAIVAGLAPALQASRPDLASALKDVGSTFGQHLSQSRLRNGLVVTQIAVSLALLIGAGLLTRNLVRAQTIDVGFEPQHVFSVAINLNAAGEESTQQRSELRRLVAERLCLLVGVKSVSQAFRQPSSGQLSSTAITIAGRAAAENDSLRANYNFVTSEHFRTLGIPILRGRGFTEQEVNSGAPVLVISEATAQKFWPEGDAIGEHVGIAAALNSDGDAARGPSEATVFPSYEVIGIARNTRSGWVWEKDETYLYLPLPPNNRLGNYLLVRAEGDVQRVMAAVRTEVEAVDPRLRATVRRTSDYIEESMAPFRALALVASVLGALALLLASIGLYGVMSFVVTQRTREIGVRRALGAQGSDVVRLFLKEGLRLVAIGLAVGVAAGAGIARLLAAALVDLSPFDPLTFGSVSLFLAVVAMVACYLPARRATQVDPLQALRYE